MSLIYHEREVSYVTYSFSKGRFGSKIRGVFYAIKIGLWVREKSHGPKETFIYEKDRKL